jgi:catechol 2,3-dioxygenase-like lactoylglutathione lyase family enzyme
MQPVKMVFHPTIHVPSLDESEEFFDRVFGRPSELLEMEAGSDTPWPPTGPNGYCKFTPINEVLIDSVCPDLHAHVAGGVQHFASVERPALFNIGWYCDASDETFRLLRRAGIPLMSQFGRLVEGEEPPTSEQGGGNSNVRMFFTPPGELGLRYQFMQWFALPFDPRSNPAWSLPAVSPQDPLGIERLSHHVILTKDPQRAMRLTVDALGGTVIHEGRDELRKISGPYVHLADAVFHYAVPDEGSPAATALARHLPEDAYYAMTWKVVDIERVARHLESAGVKVEARSDDAVVSDSATSLNLPWGFTTKLPPGDPRNAS